MSIEQPSKFICEICGGAHHTSEHKAHERTRSQDFANKNSAELRHLFGDIEVEKIVDPERYERIEKLIEEKLDKEFAESEARRKAITFNEFIQWIRKIYIQDEVALTFLDRKFEGLEQQYHTRLEKLERTRGGNYDYDEWQALRNGDPWDIVRLRTDQNWWYKGHRFYDVAAHSLYYVASFLKKSTLEEKDISADIQNVLQGKRILVLGDDIGTLSEVLRNYGAESYGVEIDKLKVLIAHSGILAKDRRPQEQVIEGNLDDIFDDEETELIKKLKSLGPFDMIFSYRVFNEGSGIESVRAIANQRKFTNRIWNHGEKGDPKAVEELLLLQSKSREKLESLLGENGLQLHLGVDPMDEYFFPRKYRCRAKTFKESPLHSKYGIVLIPKAEAGEVE